MKYINDYTKEVFDNFDDCKASEKAYENSVEQERIKKEMLKAERKNRAEEVEKAREEMLNAQKNYSELMKKFVNDYGSYHTSFKDVKDIPYLFSDLLNEIFH